MPLFNKLKDTNLKSLKYGNSFGNGSYSEPIITIPIKDTNSIGVQYSISEEAKANGYRVSYLLNELSRGTQFINNQNRLNEHNVKLESLNGRARLNPLYNPQNTITQAEHPDIGFHFPRNLGDGTYKYNFLVNENSRLGYNRLERLYNKFEVGNQKIVADYQFKQNFFESIIDLGNTLGLPEILGGFNSIKSLFNATTDTNNARRDLKGLPRRPGLNRVNNWFNKASVNINRTISTISTIASYFPQGDGEVDSYQAGPSGGIRTNIPRTTYTNDLRKRNQILEFAFYNIQERRNFLDYQHLRITSLFDSLGDQTTNLGFEYQSKPEIKNSVYTKTIPSTGPGDVGGFDIVEKNLETTTKLRTEFDGNSYTYKSSPNRGVKSSSNPNSVFWDRNGKVNAYTDYDIDERMPIIFKAIDPFTGNINENDVLSFSAYLSDFSDNYSPTWSATSYIGRSEDFYVYNKFSRTVSFNLQIPCFNQIDLQEKHDNLAKLVSSTMGSYGEANRLGGIIHKLTVGSYLQDQAGILSNVSYNIDNNSSWDVDQGFAHNINVAISFTVIHNFLPNYNNANQLFKVTKPAERTQFDVLESLKSKDPQQIVTDIEQRAETYVKNLVNPLINQLGPAAPMFKTAFNKVKNWGIFKRRR